MERNNNCGGEIIKELMRPKDISGIGMDTPVLGTIGDN